MQGIPKKPAEQFTVGDKSKGADYSVEEIELLIYKLRDWYLDPKSDRNVATANEAYDLAKEVVQCALLAQTMKGEPWKKCPKTFEARVKALGGYDLVAGKGVPSRRVKNPTAVRKLNKAAEESAKEVSKWEHPIDFDQAKYRAEKEAAIFEQYPELNNEAHAPLVRKLSLLFTQQEIIDQQLALGVNAKARSNAIDTLQTLGRDIEVTLELLGIHPNQLRQAVNKQKQGAIAELVAQLEADEEFKERSLVWARQTALQLWWMTQHPNGRGDGPQLEPWEVWHMTRSKPFSFTCKCGEEYPVLIDGFTPDELKDYLLKRGVILDEPTLPGMMTKEDLAGLLPQKKDEEEKPVEVTNELDEAIEEMTE